MARILVVEDEPAVAEALRQGLTDELHVVDVAADGEEGLWAARGSEYDLLILDVMLPHTSGTEICRRVRAERSAVPILMLTARDTLRDVVSGLDAGADDYLAKPFAFEELLARVRALLRSRAASRTSVIEVADLRVDLVAHRAWRGALELSLTAQEARLLEHLALHVGHVLSKSRLTDALWHDDAAPDSNVLEVLVAALRRKMAREGAPSLIHTIRGAGYVLSEEAR